MTTTTMPTRRGAQFTKKRIDGKSRAEKARAMIKHTLEKHLPLQQWYLLPLNATAMEDCRSVSLAFRGLDSRDFLSLMVAGEFFKIKGSCLRYHETGFNVLKNTYRNSSLRVEAYRNGNKRVHYITRENNISKAPPLKVAP